MSAKHTLNPGDTCYGQHGQEAIFLARSGGEFIVRPIYEDDNGPHEGSVESWSAAFQSPPAPKLDAETKQAEQTLASLRMEIGQLHDERRQMDADHKSRMDRIKMHEGLEMLDRYLVGEITHYVATHEYYPIVQIIPIGETVEGYPSSNGYGLLKLMPSRAWDKRIVFSVTFQSGRHSYDSRTTDVIPCFGEEDAKTKASEWITQKVAEYLALEPRRRSYISKLFSACAVYGIAVPQQLIDDQHELDRANLLEQREKAQQGLIKIESELSALTSAEGGAV